MNLARLMEVAQSNNIPQLSPTLPEACQTVVKAFTESTNPAYRGLGVVVWAALSNKGEVKVSRRIVDALIAKAGMEPLHSRAYIAVLKVTHDLFDVIEMGPKTPRVLRAKKGGDLEKLMKACGLL